MMKHNIPVVLCSLALAVSSVAVRLYSTDPAADAAPEDPKAIALYTQALHRDQASAYRWADLGGALAAAGRDAEARHCFDRARTLAPNIPAIWLRHTNFALVSGDTAAALQSAAHVLTSVPDYDTVLFNYFDRMIGNPRDVLKAIGGDRRAVRSYLFHLIAINHPAGARAAWKLILSSGFGDDSLAASYVEYLLRAKAWRDAQAAWSAWLGDRGGDYPTGNLVFNGRFASEPTGSPLDWRIASNPGIFETHREDQAIRIAFHGKTNVTYDHLSQIVILPAPGRYLLSARIKTDKLTTNEGVRLAATELGVSTGGVTGTNDWMPLTLEFSSAQARSIRIAVIRTPSQKFDNKIAGTVWLTGVTLVPHRLAAEQ